MNIYRDDFNLSLVVFMKIEKYTGPIWLRLIYFI